MRSSIRSKLITSHLAVIFLAMAVATFLLLTLGREYFINALEQSLTAQAHLIARTLIPEATITEETTSLPSAYNAVQQQAVGNVSVQVEDKTSEDDLSDLPTIQESNLAYLNEISVALSTAIETRFYVLDNQGVVLVDSTGDEVGKDLAGEEVLANALLGELASQTRTISGEDWLFVAVPVWTEDLVAGVVYLGQPLRDVAAVLNDLRMRLLLVLVIALPLSALIGFMLARNIASPIKRLTVASGRLSQGDYDYPLGTPSQDELGQLSTSFASMRDQLQSVERMRTQFVSDVSHELRTPLTAIKGLTETLRNGAADDPSVRDHFLASMESETDRLIRMVNDLLILSRADSQALSIRPEEVDLAALTHSVVERLVPSAEVEGIEFQIHFDQIPFTVEADPDRIEQVLVNLLDNAIKHSPAGEPIRIEGAPIRVHEEHLSSPTGPREDPPPVLPPGEWCVIRITDAGEGIPPGDLIHVFDRFYRTDQSRSRDHGGSGLGLSIAKALVEAHDGYIWLESPANPTWPEGKHAGTTASFALPKKQ
ncbi:MAG: HAMP domain-containing protein [Anaerolineales bacterium]|nr:HAMP domain-containing protein [Anaerolineales bacterium]